MVKIPPEGMSQVIPYLFYDDVPAACDWLAKAFGFEQIMLDTNPNGGHHGELRCGTGVIMLSTARDRFGTKSPRAVPASTHGVFVYLDGVDDHFARAKQAGAEIVQGLSDQSYGRTYWARDLEGRDWYFTTPPA